MITVILPTANRPQMLRTALRSIDRQTAKSEIAAVLVSENAGNRESGAVCEEFPSLPIHYIFRDPPLTPIDHALAIVGEACSLPHQYVADLHDDDWWGINHVATGVKHLQANPDASSYWCASTFVHGERSWSIQIWNISSWVATGYPPLTQVAKVGLKEAALACVPSGPAHYSGLIAARDTLAAAFPLVMATGNEFDNDKLLFLELAKRGPVLLNHVPEVFVRQHPAQDQLVMPRVRSTEHVAAATRTVLDFCRARGIDVVREFERLYDECPVPQYRPHLINIFDDRVMAELERQDLLPRKLMEQPPALGKRVARQLCPPFVWNALSRRKAVRAGTNGAE